MRDAPFERATTLRAASDGFYADPAPVRSDSGLIADLCVLLQNTSARHAESA
jgi:hypothetical protein